MVFLLLLINFLPLSLGLILQQLKKLEKSNEAPTGSISTPLANISEAPTGSASKAPLAVVSAAPLANISEAPTGSASKAPLAVVSAPLAVISEAPLASVSGNMFSHLCIYMGVMCI
ncbi:larval cuticle protein F1-like [Hydra vulgaris]|uniref:larval cuticle protein F1-like n=1 Tax=Hydra vulgaris TaxID=6087 RepID=UPI0032EA3EA8